MSYKDKERKREYDRVWLRNWRLQHPEHRIARAIYNEQHLIKQAEYLAAYYIKNALKVMAGAKEYTRRLQGESLNVADNHRQPWDSDDTDKLRVLAKTSTGFEAALELGRSFRAVGRKASKLGVSFKKPRIFELMGLGNE